jgi:SAM-dependent methyltransferase
MDVPATIAKQAASQTPAQVYERSLALEPERKRAGGIYYTPAYLVDYIVRQTVGRLLEGCTPRQAAKIRILDPACGAGAFLLGAYSFLLDWHRGQYVSDGPEKHPRRICRDSSGRWQLTVAEKGRILLNSIYGVDIDPGAVEVAKRSLLLKMLEGDQRTASGRLADLSSNVHCGNALIGPDSQMAGFDVIVGNPPHGARLSPAERAYLRAQNGCSNTDTAAQFLAQSLDWLRPGGRLGYVLPKPLVYASNWAALRQRIAPRLHVLVDAGKAWNDVKLEQCIVILGDNSDRTDYSVAVRSDTQIRTLGTVPIQTLSEFGFLLNAVSPAEVELARRIRSRCARLGAVASNRRGARLQSQAGSHGNYAVLGGKQIQRWRLCTDVCRRIPKARINDDRAWIRPNTVLVQNIVAHIENPVDHIKIIATCPDPSAHREAVILDTVNQFECRSGVDARYLCALLNSRFLNWYAYRFLFGKAIRTMHFDAVTADRLPIPRPWSAPPAVVRKLIGLAQTQLESGTTERTRQIDRLVYRLIELTEDDIAMVEAAQPESA